MEKEETEQKRYAGVRTPTFFDGWILKLAHVDSPVAKRAVRLSFWGAGASVSMAVQHVLGLAPIAWAGVYLALALHSFRGVPLNWCWDTFTYLNAVDGWQSHVTLGWGRTLYLWVGWVFQAAGTLLNPHPLWGVFRLWVYGQMILYAGLLTWGGRVLPRVMGAAGAHVVLALLAIHPILHILQNNLWPETWAMMVFGVGVLWLLGAPGASARGRRWRIAGAGACGAAMILFKEVYVYYVPGLSLLVLFWGFREGAWWKRVLATAGWTLAVAAGAYGVYAALPLVLPGLSEAREEWFRSHMAQKTVGIHRAPINAIQLWGHLSDYPALTFLCGLSLLRWVAEACYRPRVARRWSGAFLVALSLVLAPAVLLVFTSNLHALSRYFYSIVPGLGLLAALGLVMPPPPLLQRAWIRRVIFLVALGALVYFNGWKHYAYFLDAGERARDRYREMEKLSGTRLGIVGADDAMVAYYLQQHSSKQPGDRWVIFWPKWDVSTGARPPRRWVEDQLAAGLRIAVSPSVATRAGEPLDRMLGEYGIAFEKHASGWWISSPAAEAR